MRQDEARRALHRLQIVGGHQALQLDLIHLEREVLSGVGHESGRIAEHELS